MGLRMEHIYRYMDLKLENPLITALPFIYAGDIEGQRERLKR
jgi:hypothetical protein